MSDKVVLVSSGDAIYAVPVDVCEKYALEGDALISAEAFFNEEADVSGQTQYLTGMGSNSGGGRSKVAELNKILDKATGRGNSR